MSTITVYVMYVCLQVMPKPRSGVSDPHNEPPAQPVQLLTQLLTQLLAQMLAEMAMMCQDWAVAQREHLIKLQEHSDWQTRSWSRWRH